MQCLQKKLPQSQQKDPRNAQEAHHQCRDKIDGEHQPREAGNQIQQPQADKARQGIDGQLGQTAQLRQEYPDQKKACHDGDQQRENIFHKTSV